MPASPAFTVRHVQLARAALAAVAALLITFSSDHSAELGLAVFAGFALLTALILVLAAWLAEASGGRWPYLVLGLAYFAAGMLSSFGPLRSTTTFFTLLTIWALTVGSLELLLGLRARHAVDPTAHDAIAVGALTIVLGIALLLIPADYDLDYVIEEAGSFTLTGIILGVGSFGAWAWIVAVYLAIAGLSPRRRPIETLAPGASENGSAL